MNKPPMKAIEQIKKYCEKTQCRKCIFGMPEDNNLKLDDLIRRQSAINAIENTDVPMSAKEWDELTDAIVAIPAVDYVPMDFHDRCMQMEIRKRIELEKFARWVLDEIWDDDRWDSNQIAFQELVLRKLARLGMVAVDEENNLYLRPDVEDGDGDG